MRSCLLAWVAGFSIAVVAFSQPVDPKLFGEMRYRSIGPFRGGRTVAAAGAHGAPDVFYVGVADGGVWRSDDYGRVWTPIFDGQSTGSIGAVAVAPSNPDILYVGSGEGLQRPDLSTGDGMYKSVDGGRTWEHLGLRDSQQIPAIVVDPRDPNRLFVAVLGHPYGPNAERGIFRSLDGGRTFAKVLFRDEDTGAADVALDPSNPRTVYAVLWSARQGPWENANFVGATSGLFKSTDGGTTWAELKKGLPTPEAGLSRIGIDVSRSNPSTIYAIVNAQDGGLYRSDDAGASWRRVNDDTRLWGRGDDFAEVRVDPSNRDVVYVANVVTWKSTDGGKTFEAFRGAPGGDDYHRVWIDPKDPKTMLFAVDQGAVITVNGGSSWSSWYNQPTAQFYHVNTDNAFPYRVCGGQQESGSACVASRSDDGRITLRDWHPVGAEEYGFAVPDPLDPDIVYGGKVTRYDRRTDQVQQVGPKVIRDGSYRTLRTAPLVFSPVDPHTLYFGANMLWKTTSGGASWAPISPDLSRRPTWTMPPNVGIYGDSQAARPVRRGVIYTVAPSPLDGNRIWAGTDDGLIHVTTDGGASWRNVTPGELVPWAKVSVLEASHFDASTAYAAVNTFRLDDLRPHIYRTRDGGSNWASVTSGLPGGSIVNVVREDPKRRGLLYAGTENTVYVSFDDGDHWQPLQLNLPSTSIRDLTVHGDDLVIATHGRGFWILDDLEPLRQLNGSASATASTLFRPQTAIRVRGNRNTDTPMPPDEPGGQNPPDGAIIDYVIGAPATHVTLEIADAAGSVVRRYTSEDPVPPIRDEGQVPRYWIRPPMRLSAAPGMHRFVWDLHYAPAAGSRPRYPMSAVVHDTPLAPTSPWAMPGSYTVRLNVDGTVNTAPLTVVMDPRVHVPDTVLQQQFELSRSMYEGINAAEAALDRVRSLRREKGLDPSLEGALASLEGSASEYAPPAATEPETLTGIIVSMRSILSLLQEADAAPTSQVIAAVAERRAALDSVMARWRAVEERLPH